MHLMVKPGRRIMGRLKRGDDLLQTLEKLCLEQNITLGQVQAIGAVSAARVGYYHQAAQRYEFLEWRQPLEILALTGNISLKDGKPMVHAHVTLADADGRAVGGHLGPGAIVFAAEFIIQEHLADQTLMRQMDLDTGLFLWPPEQFAD